VAIEWDDALVTGDAEIDDQHRMIFALAAKLQSTCDLYCDQADRIADAVYGLADYTVEHFADEESFMHRCGYPEASAHRALHQHLSSRTLKFVADYMNGEEMAPETLAEFVTEWLRDHILAEDVRIVAFAVRHPIA